jgi:hypothetical protein
MLRAPRPEIDDELNGASSAQQEIAHINRNESEARIARASKMLGAKWRRIRLFDLLIS